MVTVLFGVSLIHVYGEVLPFCHVSVSLEVSAKRDAFISLCRVGNSLCRAVLSL